jgi:glycerol-3-phosphate cytidylyltransferase
MIINEKIGFTCSSFDLLHAGHVTMLKECKDNCDKLIVGLNVNPCKNGKYPVQSVVERYVQLSAISGVDEIIPYNTEEELVDLLQLYRIDVRFIGDDYKDKPFTGDDLPMEIFFNRRDHRFSSSGLKQAVIKNQETKQLEGNVVKDNDTYIIVDNTELTKLTVSTTTLRPGKETTGHSHDGIEEVYTFMSGTGKMQIGDNEFSVEAGKTFTIPDGAFHKVYNTSHDEDLFFICVFNQRRDH